jgi:hypothetical protein
MITLASSDAYSVPAQGRLPNDRPSGAIARTSAFELDRYVPHGRPHVLSSTPGMRASLTLRCLAALTKVTCPFGMSYISSQE